MRIIALCFILLACALATEYTSYQGYKLLRVTPKTAEEVKDVNAAVEKLGLDLWYWHNSESADIMVPASLSNVFTALNIDQEVIHEDVQAALDEQKRSNNATADPAWFESYHQYPVIQEYLEDLIASNNDKQISSISVGKSYLGLDISGVKIGTGSRKFFFNGGQHAREWLTPPTVCYIATQLLLPENQKYYDAFEWHLAPVMNPDGYQYTWTNNRLWRKNRAPTSNPSCVGTDLNRNWAYQWNTGGSSSNPCSDTFHGGAPFNAVETKAVSDYITAADPVAYIDFHCCGQMWMQPWGYSCRDVPADNAAQQAGGEAAAAAIRATHGRNFAVGGVCQVIYQASGGSNDWTYGGANVKYSYAIEARGSFTSPASEIKPCVEELWAGVKAMADYIIANN